MATKKCIICGKKIGRTVKLPHGSIDLCHGSRCLRTLNYKIDKSVALLWVSMEDLTDREVTDPVILKKANTMDGLFGIANSMESCFDDYFWESYSTSLQNIGEDLEKLYVKKIKNPHLHLDIQLKSKEARKIFDQLLKGETPNDPSNRQS